jgi:hypothetical protein
MDISTNAAEELYALYHREIVRFFAEHLADRGAADHRVQRSLEEVLHLNSWMPSEPVLALAERLVDPIGSCGGCRTCGSNTRRGIQLDSFSSNALEEGAYQTARCLSMQAGSLNLNLVFP